MRMIGVGDHVVDCYLDERLFYPGGNAVNVAVGCARAGCEAAYLGVFGDDEEAGHLRWALEQERISTARCRVMHGFSGHPGVRLTADGDRVFVGGPRDTAQHVVRLRLTQEDLDYIEGFDICHTSCYSSIESELKKLKDCCDVSFDFSSGNTDKQYLSLVCPYVRFAFFSGSDMPPQELDELISAVHGLGTEIVGITLGSRGALFSQSANGRVQRYTQGIIRVPVVDTMGAGDSFIAGFLTRFCQQADMTEALRFAAERAAKTCGEHGGFGYGRPLPEGRDFDAWHKPRS